jgi:hypothetical protein
MTLISLFAAALSLSTPPDARSDFSCLEGVKITARANRLRDLPEDVKEGLNFLETHVYTEKIAEAGSPIPQSDAPSLAEQDYPQARFAQALLVNDRWFVQIEVSLWAGVRTISFFRGGDGRFHFSPSHYFNGPACESIRAALSGVTTPGRF